MNKKRQVPDRPDDGDDRPKKKHRGKRGNKLGKQPEKNAQVPVLSGPVTQALKKNVYKQYLLNVTAHQASLHQQQNPNLSKNSNPNDVAEKNMRIAEVVLQSVIF